MTIKQPTEVEVGQVWVDKDIRAKYDEFTVIGIHEGNLFVEPYAICQRGPRQTRIKLSRLLAPYTETRGYKYIGKQR
jgi:hypothetical protein